MRKVKVCPFLTSVLMSVLLILGSFAPYVHASGTQDPTNGNNNDSKTERIYEGDGYKVTFSLNSSWNTGYNLGVEIENTGSESIQNWHLSFDYAGEITNIWCAEIQESTGDGYIVKNAGYNMDIAPGEKTSFGISENTAFPGFPENVIIPCGDNETVTGEYSVVYTVENDWGNGFVGNICITNNTGSAINDWNLEFDFAREIISVWGAVIESSENGHYVVRHAVDNPDILPGQSVTIGMIGSGGTITDVPSGYDLTSYGFTDVQIDDPDLDEDTDGDGLTNGLEEAIGTDPGLADTDGDGLSDYQELYLTWTDPLLIDTDNNGVSDANEDLDGDGLGNLDEITRGTDTGNPDTDRDDLSDYAEVYEYGTDPLNPDSDGDTLSDGDDVLLGFSPLLPDTDNNGILDCNEIVYQTTENDFPLGDGRGITNVSVSMNISGNIEKEVGILNMYDFDVQSREVVGIIGVPMEIRSDVAFDTATITFTYDESMLGDTSEEDLSLMWYDEENNWYQILDQECVVDTVNNTVSYTTTHFSTYNLVDRYKWFNTWNSPEYNEWMNNASSLIGDYVDYIYYYEIYRDRIEDRDTIDFYSLNLYPSFNTFFALNENKNYCLLGDNSLFSRIIMFNHLNDSNAVMVLYQNISDCSYFNGFYFNSLVENKLTDIQESDFGSQNKKVSIIVVNDGLLQIEQRTIDTCIANNFQINVIDYYYPSSSSTLVLAALQTGGKYYNAQYGIDNEKVAGELGLKIFPDIIEDGDEDKVPDYFEINGIKCSNGKVYYSNPEVKNSDLDGWLDYKEVGDAKTLFDAYIGSGKNINAYYFTPLSNPSDEDSDDDGIYDDIDPCPLVKYISDEVKVSNEYKYDYLCVENLNGGNQNWWDLRGDFSGFSSEPNDLLKNIDYLTYKKGCGVIAFSDLEIFLSQTYGFQSYLDNPIPLCDEYGKISMYDYMRFADYNRDNIPLLELNILFAGGAHASDMVYPFREYLIYNGVEYPNVVFAKYTDKKRVLSTIEKMISNNLPILCLYHSSEGKSLDYYSLSKSAINESSSDKKIDAHFMSIVGFVKYDDGSNELKTLLIIESWGDFYYVKYDDFARSLDVNTNILSYEI